MALALSSLPSAIFCLTKDSGSPPEGDEKPEEEEEEEIVDDGDADAATGCFCVDVDVDVDEEKEVVEEEVDVVDLVVVVEAAEEELLGLEPNKADFFSCMYSDRLCRTVDRQPGTELSQFREICLSKHQTMPQTHQPQSAQPGHHPIRRRRYYGMAR